MQSNLFDLPVGEHAPDFDLVGIDDRRHTLASFAEAKALVVIFSCNHCPYVKAVEDRLVALQHEFADRGVQLVAINANDAEKYPDDGFAAMKERAREKSFPFPYLRDEDQSVAKAYGAACTPEPFVFDAARKLTYRGRIDDSWKDPSAVTTRDLAKAIEKTLAGEAIDWEPVGAMGCSIKWKPEA